MSLTDAQALRYLHGELSCDFRGICQVYGVINNEIPKMGLETFYRHLSIINSSKYEFDIENEELKEKVEKLTDLQFFLFRAFLHPTMYAATEAALHFFIHEPVKMISTEEQECIIVGPLEERRIINEENFTAFINLIKNAYGIATDDEDEDEEEDPRLRAHNALLKKGRAIVAKIKSARNGDTNIGFSDLISSLAARGNGLNIINIWDISYYAFLDQLKRMGYIEEYDTNMRAAMAGASIGKDKLQHWIRHPKLEP